jgi:hypothetical protein
MLWDGFCFGSFLSRAIVNQRSGAISQYIVTAVPPVFRCFYFRCDECQAAWRVSKGAIIHSPTAIGASAPRIKRPTRVLAQRLYGLKK